MGSRQHRSKGKTKGKGTMAEQLADAQARIEGDPQPDEKREEVQATAPPQSRQNDPPRATATTAAPTKRKGGAQSPGRFPAQQPKRARKKEETAPAKEATVDSLLEQYASDPESVSPVLVNLLQLKVLDECNRQFQTAVDDMRQEVRDLGGAVNEALEGLRQDIGSGAKTTGRPRPRTRARAEASTERPAARTVKPRPSRATREAPGGARRSNGRDQGPKPQAKRAIHRRIDRRRRTR